MTQAEFKQRLKEDKFFENPEEMLEYRFPVVEYYLKHYINMEVIKETKRFNINSIPLIKDNSDENFRRTNQAFNTIKDLVLNKK